jgi:hypothetical protein
MKLSELKVGMTPNQRWREKSAEHIKAYRIRYKAENPWHLTYVNIQKRCENPKSKVYKNYGGRGIKNELTHADLKILWNRDNAGTMKRPSIDRIDNDKNYTLENCRYIELSQNIRNSRLVDGKPRTHCNQGHEYTPENTLTSAKARWCKTCTNARRLISRKRRRYLDECAEKESK